MRRLAVALVAVSAVVAGCEGGEDARLVVSAAASLTEPLTACSRGFGGAEVRLSFAGSDELAAQIRQGVEPEVFAAANTRLPERLHREGLLGPPVVVATNELVVAAGRDTAIRRVEDLAEDGRTVVMGAASVPVGAYTRDVLGRLPEGVRRGVLANVRSNEPDVKGVVAKVTQGAADAGFAYRSDVVAAQGRLRAVALPAHVRPEVAYGAGVVQGARRPALARRYLDDLVRGRCANALRRAGFGAPPGR